MGNMRLITLHLPKEWIQELDELVRRRLYANRSQAIRTAVRDLLLEESPRRRRP